jgi:hypothetical protein
MDEGGERDLIRLVRRELRGLLAMTRLRTERTTWLIILGERVAPLNGEVSRGERMAMIDALAALRVLTRDWERNAVGELKRHKPV